MLAILRMSENIPTSKDKLNSSDNQCEKKVFKILNMKIGTLLARWIFYYLKHRLTFQFHQEQQTRVLSIRKKIPFPFNK